MSEVELRVGGGRSLKTLEDPWRDGGGPEWGEGLGEVGALLLIPALVDISMILSQMRECASGSI